MILDFKSISHLVFFAAIFAAKIKLVLRNGVCNFIFQDHNIKSPRINKVILKYQGVKNAVPEIINLSLTRQGIPIGGRPFLMQLDL